MGRIMRITPRSVPSTKKQSEWAELGLDESTLVKTTDIKEWPKVKDTNGDWVTADKIMDRHWHSEGKPARIGDSIGVGAGGGYNTGAININQINNLAIDNVFLGWGELSLLQQNCIVNLICTIMAQSMTEKWIKFKGKKSKVKELEKAIKHYDVREKIFTAIHRTFLLGTYYISPKLKGDEVDLENELLLSDTKIKGNLEGFDGIEPTWVVPIEFNMVNPRAPNFYKPTSYIVFGTKIHPSRLKRLMIIEPVNLLSPMYLFGGLPPVQNLLPYILDFINTKREVVRIVSRLNTSVLSTNLNALKGADAYGKATTAAGSVKARARAFTTVRNSWGVFLIDAQEKFEQIQINTAGLMDILQQQGELLALFSQIPVSKLFGQSPRGMNSTGEYDEQNFNQLIKENQESKLRPMLEYMFSILMINMWGKIDESIEFEFVPLGELSETVQSQLKTDKVNRALATATAGASDPVAIMDMLVRDEDLDLGDYQPIDGDNDDE